MEGNKSSLCIIPSTVSVSETLHWLLCTQLLVLAANEVLTFHCLTHKQAPATKNTVTKCNVVLPCVNQAELKADLQFL